MCGIAGILTFDGAAVDAVVLRRMGLSVAHRGPDADGVYTEDHGRPGIGLVHRRLAIIDLSAAAEAPLANEDGTVLAMLNGEIYNFLDLRRDLERRHAFRSHGDTEVLVHGYEEQGEDIIRSLDGMFALAIWDSRRRRLILARDPFGKKPLYYFQDAHRFVFGSEIKPLLAAGVPAELEEDNLAEYLALGYVPTPRTLLRGIQKVPPGTLLIVDASGTRTVPYWDLCFPADGAARRASDGEAVERVATLLRAAIGKRLIADVPLGVLLSGGIDSAAVAAVASRLVPGRLKTFTVGFEGPAFYDERAAARLVARHIGSDHHESVVRPHAAGLVETLLGHYDEPFGDPSALPTFLVAQEARRHVTVVLNGDGADETFAGYERFHAAALAERIPQFARHALRMGASVVPRGSTYHGTLRRVRRFTDQASMPLDERIAAWCGFFDLSTLERLASNGLADRSRVLASYREALARCSGASLLSRLLYLNARTYLLDDLLPKMDRMTMAHGLEARSPFLDRELVEYVAGLPDALKRRGGSGKIVLRRAVADLVPLETLRRPKHGFGVPLGAWFRAELKPMLTETLGDQPRLGRWLRVDRVRDLIDEHLAGRCDWGHQLWTLLTLELWLRKHRFA